MLCSRCLGQQSPHVSRGCVTYMSLQRIVNGLVLGSDARPCHIPLASLSCESVEIIIASVPTPSYFRALSGTEKPVFVCCFTLEVSCRSFLRWASCCSTQGRHDDWEHELNELHVGRRTSEVEKTQVVSRVASELTDSPVRKLHSYIHLCPPDRL